MTSTDNTVPGEQCTAKGCTKDARMAIASRRTIRTRDITSTVYYDDRQAPKGAQRYCKEHGALLVKDLVTSITREN